MTDVTNALEAVGVLSAERTKYEGWITALAAKTDVPAHVLEKVHADYTSRLRTVLQGFAAHTPALEAALGELQLRDGALAAQEKNCRDEHAEGELRHMVGEYDGDQWDKVRIGHEALLGRLASERQGIAGELLNVQRSLAAAGEASQRARAIGDPGGVGASSARPDAVTPAVQMPVTDSSAPPPVSAMPNQLAPFEIGYDAPQLSAEPAVERRASVEDLGFLRTAPRAPTPRDSEMAPEPISTGTATKSPETPMLRIVPSAPPAGPVDAAKTLRCGECGTMNYATEWYCERCGGELAVL